MDLEAIKHYLALFTILISALFFCVMVTGLALWGKEMEEEYEEPEYEEGELDKTYYPDDEDEVIFPH